MPDQPPSTPETGPDSPTPPRVWVGSLADYNAGDLVGDWVDAAVPMEDALASIQSILARSNHTVAEEWGFFDFEGFGNFRINEYEDVFVVSAVARGIERHGLAFAAWAELCGGDLDRLKQFRDVYLGEFDQPLDYVDSLLDELGLEHLVVSGAPDWLRPYVQIDRDGILRDLQLAGDIAMETGADGKVWVFDGRA